MHGASGKVVSLRQPAVSRCPFREKNVIRRQAWSPVGQFFGDLAAGMYVKRAALDVGPSRSIGFCWL